MSSRQYIVEQGSNRWPKGSYITYLLTPLSFLTGTYSSDNGLAEQPENRNWHKRHIDGQHKNYESFEFEDEGFRICR